MKTIRLLIAFLAVAVMAGCASTGGYRDTVTGTVAGGLIGGALGGNTGARTGALLGAGIGALVDSKDRKDGVRGEKIDRMIDQKTGATPGTGNAQVAGAVSQAEANIMFAKGERDKCQAAFATYKKAGIKKPYNCEQVFEEALHRAEAASPDTAYYGYGGCSDVYLRSYGVSPGSRHADMWCRQLRENEYNRYSYRYGHRRH